MSISVDDLVASLSSNHIGQEAMDLAALQAQLAQTLFTQSFTSSAMSHNHPVSPESSYTQPCNTPTATSSSFSFGSRADAARQRSLSLVGHSPRKASVDESYWREMDEMEDERMVEDLLVPSSPIPLNPSSSHFSIPRSPLSPTPKPMGISHTSYSFESPSSFTSTDPFYIAQLQAANNLPPQSFFSQTGQPSQHSPFVPTQSQLRREPHRFPISGQLDSHPLFSTPATSVLYER